jgi:tetratricopeptide (TPR) repeat protein
MSKKRKRRRKSSPPRGWKAPTAQVRRWSDNLQDAVIAENHAHAKRIAEKILRHVPKRSAPGREALAHLGTALSMLEEFEAAYQVYSEALELDPEMPVLWYNRSLSASLSGRTGQALLDLKKAIALEDDPALLDLFQDRFELVNKLVAEELALRGPDFTLDDLVEQQRLFAAGMTMMEKKRYKQAEAAFKRVIAMGAVLPQPWANLGGGYLLQERYDDAEAAFKRALEVDPTYELAARNLKMLPEIRKRGIYAYTPVVSSPFKGMSQSQIFIEE